MSDNDPAGQRQDDGPTQWAVDMANAIRKAPLHRRGHYYQVALALDYAENSGWICAIEAAARVAEAHGAAEAATAIRILATASSDAAPPAPQEE